MAHAEEQCWVSSPQEGDASDRNLDGSSGAQGANVPTQSLSRDRPELVAACSGGDLAVVVHNLPSNPTAMGRGHFSSSF